MDEQIVPLCQPGADLVLEQIRDSILRIESRLNGMSGEGNVLLNGTAICQALKIHRRKLPEYYALMKPYGLERRNGRYFMSRNDLDKYIAEWTSARQ